MKNKSARIGILLAVLALVAAACSNTSDDTTTTTAAAAATTTTAAAATTTTAAAATTTTAAAGGEVAFDVGVTAEPCPEGDPDRGCIYLGILTDESGPFAAASPALVGAQRAFWAGANAAGGIGGEFDVALPDDLARDTQYLPDVFVQQYNDIAGEIAAVAQSLGTSQTIAALDDYNRDNTAAAPMSWWSGWAFDDVDHGLIVEFGTNYCFEAMNAVDWSMEAVPAAGRPAPTSVGILAIPNDYGLDYSAGVIMAAEANGLEVAWEAPVIPVSAGGDPTQAEAIQQILASPVDVVYLVTGPTETAAIVAGAASQGATNLFIGAGPSWNVGILATAAAPAFEAGIYFQSNFVGPWQTDTPGHEAMRQTLAAGGIDESSANDFFVAGWVSQYGLKAALDQAYASGDLTKEGIATAARSLTTVSYQDMMADRSFGGDPNTEFPRMSLMGAVDVNEPTGISVIQDFFVGPTSAAFEFTEACAG
ncbi:MAG: ABC transporter substrate-binding protein [Acidimicrobiia bacterium]